MPIHVYSSRGREHEASALQLESGPDYVPPAYLRRVTAVQGLDPSVLALPDSIGGGLMPLLITVEPPVIVPVGNLPVGRRIQVRGYMGVGLVHERLNLGTAGSRVHRDAQLVKSQSDEHYIIVTRYKVLRD